MNMNPMQFIQALMGNNQMMQNPMAKNAIDMMQKGDANGVEQMARNLCKENGVDADEMMKMVRSKFGM